ncbi:MAG: nucleotidyltransferase domain-containing protein [Epsilonproteobacteria bacterium]|nr:nucleotidyltransferase domain-containing protein [Campylobacterota bacterium]
MVNIENIQNEILNALKPLQLDKVILFGSYAYGTPHKNSDIDLYIVTNDEYIPQSYKEKRALVWKVSQKILDIRKEYAIDLLVHTKKMHEKFVELQSSFSKEILEKGRVLL